MADRLADAVSPYLQQHRHNPVDWWEWGDEAFEEARQRDVPVFLSVGYATCHWCHVMAHESFEDPEVAAALNDAFVCIKVDREERPDVDAAYMAVCQAMTGRGGWPLTVLLDADRRPFWTGTYLPKRGRGGRMGLLELVARVKALWREDRAALLQQAGHIVESLQAPLRDEGPEPSWDWILRAVQALKDRVDPVHGGIGTAPKFPSPHQYRLLLRYHVRTGDPDALGVALRALDAMDRGGIHDHVGRGFHRYSTDPQWHLPHFEKMLYDQATLLLLYAEAHQATGEARWAGVAEDIATYLLTDLRDPCGAFHSAEDADAAGEEGVFHSWTHEEVIQILGDDAEAFCAAYGIRAGGNFHDEVTGHPTGRNLLHRAGPHGPRFDDALARLREARARRVPPLRDDKILTDWNGLAIVALARAGAVMRRPDWIEAAARAARFLLERHRGPDGALRHRSRGGRVDDRAFLDDHAFLVWGLLELWQATQDPGWLVAAREVVERLLDFEADRGGFWLTLDTDGLPVRRRDAYDGALPSGNSVAVQVLARLAHATAEPRYEDVAWRMVRAFSAEVGQHPQAFAEFLWGVELLLSGSIVVVVTGQGPAAEALWDAARSQYLPDGLLLRCTREAAAVLPWLAGYGDGPAAYVCRDRVCQAPVRDPDALRRSLRASGSGQASRLA